MSMTNDEKHNVIASLNEHNAKLHDDCFLYYEDGRKIFREDLHKYKIDLLVKDLWDRMEQAEAQAKDHLNKLQQAEAHIVELNKPKIIEKVEEIVQKLPKHQIAMYVAVAGHWLWELIKHVH